MRLLPTASLDRYLMCIFLTIVIIITAVCLDMESSRYGLGWASWGLGINREHHFTFLRCIASTSIEHTSKLVAFAAAQ